MNQLATGKFISQKRKEKNMTQEQLAEKIGVSNKTISKWETGKCMPDYSVVKSLCGREKCSKTVKLVPKTILKNKSYYCRINFIVKRGIIWVNLQDILSVQTAMAH